MTARRIRRRTLWIALSSIAVVAGVAAAVWVSLQPPATPPAYAGARPEPAEDGYETATHSIRIAAPADEVLAWSNDPNQSLESVVQFDSGFPAVAGTEALVGEWIPGSREGDRRRVQFEDGHFLAEEVLVDTDETFRYLIWGFTSFQRLAVAHGVAEFTYEPDGDGTLLTWSYSLLPTVEPLRGAVRSFLDSTMTPMMTATLEGMRAGIER